MTVSLFSDDSFSSSDRLTNVDTYAKRREFVDYPKALSKKKRTIEEEGHNIILFFFFFLILLCAIYNEISLFYLMISVPCLLMSYKRTNKKLASGIGVLFCFVLFIQG
jgi:hypothetical protein